MKLPSSVYIIYKYRLYSSTSKTIFNLMKFIWLLKYWIIYEYNINNYQKILNILKEGTYSKELVGEAIESYNKKYNTNISLEDFTKNISGYASQKIKESVNYDEVIAEAVHDYYLHRDSSSTSSLEIINILKERLQ